MIFGNKKPKFDPEHEKFKKIYEDAKEQYEPHMKELIKLVERLQAQYKKDDMDLDHPKNIDMRFYYFNPTTVYINIEIFSLYIDTESFVYDGVRDDDEYMAEFKAMETLVRSKLLSPISSFIKKYNLPGKAVVEPHEDEGIIDLDIHIIDKNGNILKESALYGGALTLI